MFNPLRPDPGKSVMRVPSVGHIQSFTSLPDADPRDVAFSLLTPDAAARAGSDRFGDTRGVGGSGLAGDFG
jgi:hypothetical protein